MQSNGLAEPLRTQLYSLALGLMVSFYGIKNIYFFSDIPIVEFLNDAVQIVAYFILAVIIFKDGVKRKWMKYILPVGMVLVIQFMRTFGTGGIRLFLLILAARNIKITQIMKTYLFSYFMIIVLSGILYITGISNPETFRRNGISIGFNHPNVAALIVTTVLLLWIGARGKVDKYSIGVIGIVALFVFSILKTRVATTLILCFPFIYEFIRYGVRKKIKGIKLLVHGMLLIICSVSVILVIVYPLHVYDYFRIPIDELFNYRPLLNYNNVMKFGISIWSRKVDIFNAEEYAYNYYLGMVSNQKYNTVDNAYIMGLIGSGIVSMLITCTCYSAIIKKAWKNKNYLIMAISVVYAMYAFIENASLEVFYFFTFLYLLAEDDRVTALEEKNGITENHSLLLVRRE